MSSFEVAWDSITKAPYRFFDTWDNDLNSEPIPPTNILFNDITTANRNIQNDDGSFSRLYSGGDRDDTPQFWTPNLDVALNYALYGSGIGAEMRETIPTIFVANETDEDFNLYLDHMDFGGIDLHGIDPRFAVQYQVMPDEKIEELIRARLADGSFKGRGWIGDWEHWSMPKDQSKEGMRQALLEAIDRLHNKPSDRRINLPNHEVGKIDELMERHFFTGDPREHPTGAYINAENPFEEYDLYANLYDDDDDWEDDV